MFGLLKLTFVVLFFKDACSSMVVNQLFKSNVTEDKINQTRTSRLSRLPENDEQDGEKPICFEEYCLELGYDKLQRPRHADGRPLNIGVGIEGIRIIDMDDKAFSVSLQMYLGIRWTEPRLSGPFKTFYDYYDEYEYENSTFFAMDTKFIRHLWVPDLYVFNMKYGSRTLKDFDGRLFVFNGNEIFYRQELIIEIWCPLRFDFYPLDHQQCDFMIGSYAFSIDEMIFQLESLQYDWSQVNALLDYVIVEPLGENLSIQRHGEKKFSLTGFNFRLKRRSFQYIVNYYLPSVLFVVVSWTGFLVPPDLIAGRVTILITLFVVLIAIFNTVNRQSPPVDGFNALAAYVMICIIFVFGEVFYYAILLYHKKRAEQKLHAMRSKSVMATHLFPLSQVASTTFAKRNFEPKELSVAELSKVKEFSSDVASAQNGIIPPTRLGVPAITWDFIPNWHDRKMHFSDTLFIIIFPGLFTAFNIAYWYFLNNYKDYVNDADEIGGIRKLLQRN